MQEDTQEQLNKPFESFLFFVAFSLTIRFFPLVESFTNNIVLKIIVGLVFAGIIIKLFINRKLSHTLGKICKRLNLRIVYLYIVYMILYFLAALVIL